MRGTSQRRAGEGSEESAAEQGRRLYTISVFRDRCWLRLCTKASRPSLVSSMMPSRRVFEGVKTVVSFGASFCSQVSHTGVAHRCRTQCHTQVTHRSRGL